MLPGRRIMSDANKLRICYLSDIPVRLDNSRIILENMENGNIIERYEKGFITEDAEYQFIDCRYPEEYAGIYADQVIVDYRSPMIEIAERMTMKSCVPEMERIIDDRDIRTSDSPLYDKKILDKYKRKYVIVCNEHPGIFRGALLFWGHRTRDEEKRSFGGYTSDIDNCELYTEKEIKEKGYHFPKYHDGMTMEEFRSYDDILIEPKCIDKLGYRQTRIWYMP